MTWPFLRVSDNLAWRNRGGTHKTQPGTKIRWRGSWGGRIIELTTRVSYQDKMAHFMTSSNARCHFVADLGPEYVILHVHAFLPPDQLEQLRVLAEQCDGRPVEAKCNRRPR